MEIALAKSTKREVAAGIKRTRKRVSIHVQRLSENASLLTFPHFSVFLNANKGRGKRHLSANWISFFFTLTNFIFTIFSSSSTFKHLTKSHVIPFSWMENYIWAKSYCHSLFSLQLLFFRCWKSIKLIFHLLLHILTHSTYFTVSLKNFILYWNWNLRTLAFTFTFKSLEIFRFSLCFFLSSKTTFTAIQKSRFFYIYLNGFEPFHLRENERRREWWRWDKSEPSLRPL